MSIRLVHIIKLSRERERETTQTNYITDPDANDADAVDIFINMYIYIQQRTVQVFSLSQMLKQVTPLIFFQLFHR